MYQVEDPAMEAIDQGLRGVQSGFERLDRAAGRIALNGAGGDLAANMVEEMRARQEVFVNLAVIRTANATIGRLLDAYA
jgi:hypothetical protein